MIESIGIRLAIIALLCASCFGSGFVLGMEWESNARDAADLKKVKDVEIRIQKVVEEREKIVTKYVDRIVKIYIDRDRVLQEVDKHAQTIPDPRECWLAPERVRNINDAIATTGERVDTPAVPAAAPAAERQSPGRGEVGGGVGAALQRVFRSSSDGGWNLEVTR